MANRATTSVLDDIAFRIGAARQCVHVGDLSAAKIHLEVAADIVNESRVPKPFDGERHGAQGDPATSLEAGHETAPAVDFVNTRVERGLAELKHAPVIETRELEFAVHNCQSPSLMSNESREALDDIVTAAIERFDLSDARGDE